MSAVFEMIGSAGYPAGASVDPRAPFNQRDADCARCRDHPFAPGLVECVCEHGYVAPPAIEASDEYEETLARIELSGVVIHRVDG